jgi:hypothetical protein
MGDKSNLFLKKQNIEMLWNVISEEEMFKFLSSDIQAKIADMFISNIKGFFEVEGNKTNNLVDINKKYILLILNYIKSSFPQNLPNKIKIFNEEPASKELITYEEIQNEKKTQFEKELNKLQKEFTNSMSLPVPEKPEFADKYSDGPISEMDKMIKEMTEKRNYDIEQFNHNYQTNINQADNWLKSQETSVKAEKIHMMNNTNNTNNTNQQKLNNTNNISQKHISWADDNIVLELTENNEENEENEDNNILNKLKKIETPNLQENRIQNLEIKISKLEEQFVILNKNIEKLIEKI